ncbi:ATP-binding protein [Halobiforma nitratireducens]|uniref:histidine kinase n=1 Tax=Halobiforma nitratireducens JCM 10879 TaxID=1227454 RepID=M0L1C8_9EURY|nr:PAS domain-containing sensor histidine kinase [Halobiforma nitratireducens]EMA27351.1 HTR-like protein [Halobiforma nitratireducens JCM 10879]
MGSGIKRSSIDALPHEVAIVDADGTIVAVNEAWRNFADENHGTHPADWIEENYLTICEQAENALSSEDVADNLRAVLSGDRDRYQHEYPCHTPDPQQWNRLDAYRFTHDGDPYLLIVHTNISDRKHVELQANARAEQLETAIEVLQHDLRNPLNVIEGYVELLAADLDDAETIEGLQQAVTRITEITEATLTFAKSGALSETELLSVEDLARTAWLSVATADATLVVEDSHRIIGDRRLLLQLFENLFRNAIEHAGPDCRVRLGVVETGFYVEDDGPGIPPSVREKAIEADYSTRGTGGLGLALVQAVVQAHGADLTISAAADGGARFDVTGLDVPPSK